MELNIKGNQLHNLEVVYKKIDELIPYINNTRTHSNEQVAQIASSIKEFGFTNSILLDEKDGVIAGHGRIMAAKLLKMDEVPTITLSGLTEAQIKAYIIADNKLALNAGWDEEMLKLEIEALHEMDFNIDLLGFSMEELEDLDINFGEHEMPLDESKADDVPELAENPVIKLGDLIELGHNYQHRLLCGDSTSDEAVEKLMEGKKAIMTFTDPPYLMDFTGAINNDGSKSHSGVHGAIKNDKMSQADGDKFLSDIVSMIKKHCLGAYYVSFYRLGLDGLFKAFRDNELKYRALIVWYKKGGTLSNSDYKSNYEPIIYGWVKDHKFEGGKAEWDFWDIPKTKKNDLHPTMKPVELVERAVFNSSKTKNIVLDLFGGSGTTMIACENLTRSARLMELDEKYAQVIIQRYVDYTSNPMIKINGQEVDWYEYKEKNSVA